MNIRYLLLILLIAFVGCSPTDSEPEEYSLSVSMEPSGAGDVSYNGGPHEAGSEVEVSATPDEGWHFTEWTGDTSSTKNPLAFNIQKDTELTAHFAENARAFSNLVTVTDGENSFELTLGMDQDASKGFDQGMDEKAPPPPPQEAFYANFKIEAERLIKDFRPVQNTQTVWTLNFAAEGDRTITLQWDFSQTQHAGTLLLTDDPEEASFEIDMKSNSSYRVNDTSVDTLYIISN